MSDPLVSIIIPSYNAAQWLAATLDSALAQTWPRKEILVVDDGSTDHTASVAQTYAGRGVGLIAQSQRGASAARNAGLKAASGDYIQFLDADDLLTPDKIAAQMSVFHEAGSGVLVSGAWARFQQEPSEADFRPEANWKDLSGVEFLQLHYEEGCMMQPSAWLVPRALLDQAGPWDESLSLNDDGEYFARVMLAAQGIRFCREARSYYRSGLSASLSGRKDRRSLESLYKSVELTTAHLLRADSSPRTRAAAAYGWKWTAFELYPGAPDLSRAAEIHSVQLGGSLRPFPGGQKFQLTAKFLGWRIARRLFG